MDSLDIFVENLNRIARNNNLDSYKGLAEYLGVTEVALKKWQNKTRCPSLQQIDEIANKNQIYTYTLIQEGGNIVNEIEIIKNDSRIVLLDNLQKYFLDKGKFSWNDKASLFFGFVSEDNLKSYFRENNFKTPPLKRLDDMADAIGVPTYQLIKGRFFNEKTG